MKYPLSRAWYGMLLWIYPTAFRDRYASDLTLAFLHSVKIQRNRYGIWATPYTWARVLWDTITESSALRRASRVGCVPSKRDNLHGRRHTRIYEYPSKKRTDE